MAQTILLKRSALPGKTPDTGSLQLGEIAINTYDGKMYLKRSGSVESIEAIVTTGAEITGSLSILNGITGSLYGTASFAVTASFAQNIHPNVTASYAVSASQAISSSQAISASYALNATNALTASYFVTSSVTSASYAENADLLDGYDSAAFVLSSSYNQFTSSYYIDSASFSSSIAELQDFSSSLDATFATDAELNAATASLSASISYLSSSYLDSSSSFDTRILANSSSIGILSSSLMAFTASYNTGSFTGSFKGSFTGSLFGTSSYALEALSSSYALSASQAINANNALTSSYSLNINGSTNHIPLFDSPNSLVTSAIYQSNSYSVIINQDNNTSAAPEALYVWQPSTSSYNVISGKGNLDNYLQLNIQNTNNGVNASSDVVATANNGNESTNYIDMGINNENYNSGFVGEANDAYLYSTGRHLHIGNISNFPVQIFAGGSDSDANRKLEIRPDNQHQLTGSLDISGSLIVQDGITGSLFGTASFAITASYAANVPLTASFAISASQAENAISASYALTASYAANVPETASYAISASQAITASYAENFNPSATASYALEALNATNADNAISSSYAATSSYADNFTVAGTLTAQTINVQTITSSIDYVTGSTIFGSQLSNTHEFTGSVTITGSLAVNNSSVITSNQTSSMSVLSASYALTASYASNVPETASFAISASQAQNANNAVSASYALSATNATTASYFVTSSVTSASFAEVAVSASYALDATNASTAVSSSYANVATSASYAVSASQAISASYALDATNALTASYVLNAISSSYSLSSSYAYNADLLDGKDSSEFATTGSNTFIGKETISGSIRFAVTTDPDPTGAENTTYLFASSSNTALGSDLFFRQDGNLVKWKWIESQLGSSLLYGGGLFYSGSDLYIGSGSGLIVTYGASAGSEVNPILDYINWGPITASALYITSSTQTYVSIDSAGSLIQQPTWFTPYQYQQSIPLGVFYHGDRTTIRGTGGDADMGYALQDQAFAFIRAFGPLKISGLTINPISGSLSLSTGAGTAYVLGGFYQQQYEDPSHYNVPAYTTASFSRWYRSGSGFIADTNGGSFYTTIDNQRWDNGSGVLATVGNNKWTIQRVFINPTAARSAVYYGQKRYDTLAEAITNIPTDPFNEADLTAHNNVFAGYLVLQGNASNTNIADTTVNSIVQSGLYRNTTGGSGGTTFTTTLNDLSDVNIVSPTNGQALIYDGGVWINGIPVTSSYALTASYAADYTLLSAFSSSVSGTVDYIPRFIAPNTIGNSFLYDEGYGLEYTVTNSSFTSLRSLTDTSTLRLESYVSSTGSPDYAIKEIEIDGYYSSFNSYFGWNPSSQGGEWRMTAYSDSDTGPDRAVSQWWIPTRGSDRGSFEIVPYYNTSLRLFKVSANGDASIYGNLLVTGSVRAASFTGSLLGTASFATTASFALNATTASYALVATSSSYAATASYADNFTVKNTLTAQTLVVSTVSSSVVYSSGSNIFGNDLSNTQVFTGSVSITGSLAVNGTTATLGTGTVNTVPKFTAANIIGNSNITDDGSLITLNTSSYINGNLGIGGSVPTNITVNINRNLTGSTSAYGIYNQSTVQSDVTTTAVGFYSALQTQATAFTLANLRHFYVQTGAIGAGSTVTTQVGYLVSSGMTGATNNYGFQGALAAASNTWNLYMNGSASNYLAGALGIGTTSLTGRNLVIDKTLTGSTVSVSVYNTSTIQSDVTNTAAYFRSDSSTAAASFTVNTLRHYFAVQGTFGAGSVVSAQTAFEAAASLVGGTNNYGFRGLIPASGSSNWNLYMDGTADNFLAGNVGIGVSAGLVLSGPILTTTLTASGSGYVDGTYTDVAASAISANGDYALFTIVVSGGTVTTATLTWGGYGYKVGNTLTVSNTLLGGSGSGLVITVDTVDSSQLTIANASGGDITLLRNDTSLSAGENIGTIKWIGRDNSFKASGIYAEIGAFAAGTSGGANLIFYTRSITAGTPLVEAMRIDSRGGVGIGATVLVGYSLKVSKNITGNVNSYGIVSDGEIQSDVTTLFTNFRSAPSTATASFTLTDLIHFNANQGTFGAGSTVTTQYGFNVSSAMSGATTNYGFFGNLAAGTGRWNLYMNGTANNYMAGALGIGSTTLTGYTLRLGANITGATTAVGIYQGGVIQSDVVAGVYFRSNAATQATTFTLTTLQHYVANQGTFGVGSTVTNQYGFFAATTLIGATNNYGFYSDISSGSTNNWNLYMNGGAPNYLSGSLGVGKTPSTGIKLDVSGSTLMTGSLNVTNGITGSLFGTATSASYAATSSYADDFTIKNTFTFDATLNDYSSVASSISGTNNVFNRATGSYTSAFFKYTVRNTTNARTGEVMAIWNGANVEFTDFSTRDLGTTSAVTMSVSLAGGDIQFNAITNTSGWNVKAVATFM